MTDTSDPSPEDPVAAADLCVLQLYREVLQREPGPAEHAEWRNVLLRGVSPEEVRAAFLASDEFRLRQAAAEHKAAVIATRLFDPGWYMAAYPDVAAAGLDPLEHYCLFGMQEHRAPNAYFDDRWYRARSAIPPDAVALLDYAGRGEQRDIPPSLHFDPVWYRAAYRLHESEPLLAHFLAHRAGGTVAPCPRLWCVAHQRRGDASPGAGDPFLPYLTDGDDLSQRAAADIGVLEPSGLFDRNHYQIINGDVADAGLDSLTHYCVFGWKEGRNPNFYFDQRWYMQTNPDVARLQINPLVHYLLVGEPAGRRPVAFFEPAWYRRTYDLRPGVSPLAHYLAHRHSQRYSPNSLFDPAWYRAHCGDAPRSRRDLFAHYLIFGMRSDVRPSPEFDAAGWRRRTTGRPTRHFQRTQSPERDNPLVTYMAAHYR